MQHTRCWTPDNIALVWLCLSCCYVVLCRHVYKMTILYYKYSKHSRAKHETVRLDRLPHYTTRSRLNILECICFVQLCHRFRRTHTLTTFAFVQMWVPVWAHACCCTVASRERALFVNEMLYGAEPPYARPPKRIFTTFAHGAHISNAVCANTKPACA